MSGAEWDNQKGSIYMRFISRSAFLALTVVCALGAVGLASASAALPELRGTEKFPEAFTGTGEQVNITEADGGTYVCQSSSITGSRTGRKEFANIFVKINCENSNFCKSSGTFEKAIWETKELKGRIAYLEKSSKKVGLLLESVTEPFSTCNHDAIPVQIQGSIIGELTSLGGKTLAVTFRRVLPQKPEQVWRHFEGEELTHNLQWEFVHGTEPQKFGLETTIKFTLEHEVRLEA